MYFCNEVYMWSYFFIKKIKSRPISISPPKKELQKLDNGIQDLLIDSE